MSFPESRRTIQVLPQHVICRIAAGEVVERPAAVVKELIDNSLDAGSRIITVEVTDGGLGMIRVVDDGEGMSRQDATLAFERHATSKLASDEDLHTITTLGFRGEALPSIASVSKVKLVTAQRHDAVGTRVVLEGGVLKPIEETATPAGTHIEITELFFNTPARRRFLKSPATEFSHISSVVQQAGLAWPGTHFRLRHNGKDVIEFPPSATRRERVMHVYHRQFLDKCVEVSGRGGGFHFEGVALSPAHLRGGRTPQDVFVNNRWVRNAMVTHAVSSGFESSLPKDRQPQFVLFFNVDPELVDINVHPTKREVRFQDQSRIHDEVRREIRKSLMDTSGVRQETSAPGVRSPYGSSGDCLERSVASERAIAYVGTTTRGAPQAFSSPQKSFLTTGDSEEEAVFSPTTMPMLPLSTDEGIDVIPLGQISRTFLVAQVGTELHVVDQHTAHERVLFERLLRAWKTQSLVTQPLLLPATLELPLSGALLLRERLGDLERLGLTIEPFGPTTFIIRALPALFHHRDPVALVEDLVDDVARWEVSPSCEAGVRPVFATLACHGAVRAGRAMDLPEIKQLLQDWAGEGFPMTCPHGRRVALRLATEELGKIFGRG